MGSLRLPSPYPDELLLSVLARAAIHNGLAPKRLLTQLLGVPGRSSYPAFLPTDLPAIARQVRLDAKSLLWGHTIFPYVVAFMSEAEVERFEQKVLNGCPATVGSTASLVKSVTHGLPEFRFCRDCAHEDVAARGESYWRRSHCLPGVHVCMIHGSALLGAGERPRTFSQQVQMPLPHRQTGSCRHLECPPDLLIKVAKTCTAIFTGQWHHRSDWHDIYRMRAARLGFTRSNGQIAGVQIASELRAAVGAQCLRIAGCEYVSLTNPWPALMVRERSGVPFTPVKHIFLDAFLQPSRACSAASVYRKPGKTPTDAKQADHFLAMRVHRRAQLAIERAERIAVRHLMEDLGKWQFFRHHRSSLPLTVEQVNIFKKSAASARKTGGREAHAKRLQANTQGCQRP